MDYLKLWVNTNIFSATEINGNTAEAQMVYSEQMMSQSKMSEWHHRFKDSCESEDDSCSR
jgi:hypothetical protein